MAAAATSYTTANNDDDDAATTNIVIIGAGWWSQGWHLPHLHRNEKVNISAIVGELCKCFASIVTLRFMHFCFCDIHTYDASLSRHYRTLILQIPRPIPNPT